MDDDTQYEWTPERLACLRADPVHIGREMFGHEPLSQAGVTAALAALTAHDDTHIRRAAMTALAFWHHAIDPQTIVQGLADPDYDVRRTAGHVLADVARDRDKEPAWIGPALLSLANSEDAALRLTAAEAASELPRWRLDRAMVDRLRSDPDAAVRSGVLSLLRQRDAIEEGWARATVRALLTDLDPGVSHQAVSMMDRYGTRAAVEPLIGLLRSTTSGIRADTARVLGEIGDRRAVLPLIGMLEDEDAYAKDRAAEALGRIQDRRAVAPMIEILRAGRACRTVKIALRQLRDRRVVAAKESDAHSAAYWSAARNPNPVALAILLDSLSDDDPEIRGAAAMGLGRLGDKAAVVPLLSLLADEATRVTREAIIALGLLGDSQAFGPIVTLLLGSNYDVRQEAAWAVGMLSRDQPASRTGRLGQTLVRCLNSDHYPRRALLAVPLACMGCADAIGSLIALLDGDETVNDQGYAAAALLRLGGARAADALRRASDNNHVREVAHLVGKAIDERTPLPYFRLPYWEADSGED